MFHVTALAKRLKARHQMQYFVVVEATTVETRVYGDCLRILLTSLAPLRKIQVCRFEGFGKLPKPGLRALARLMI